MTSRRNHALGTWKTRRRLRSMRLVVEPLEARRLLAGINVSVYIDVNGSRGYDVASDAPAVNRLVYVDLDGNGARSDGEPTAVTGADGIARFSGLPDGDYSVGLLTNPHSQPQVDPARVATAGELTASLASERLISNADLSHVWSIDSEGVVTSIVGTAGAKSVDVGGRVLASANASDQLAWLVLSLEEGQRLVEFDLHSGDFQTLNIGQLASHESIVDLVRTQAGVVALLQNPQGQQLARLEASSGAAPALQGRVDTSATRIVGSAGTESLIAVSGVGEATRVSLLAVNSGFQQKASLTVAKSISAAALSANGQLLLLATNAGVKAISVAPNALTMAAELSEASGPLSANSQDGRIITGNAAKPQELIVWDPQLWQPIGRSQVSTGRVAAVTSSLRGNLAMASGASGVYAVDLAVASTQRVTLDSTLGTANVRLGVQTVGDNSPPDTSNFNQQRLTAEDTADHFDWLASGLTDPDDDTLWFTLETPAKHGTLSFTANGGWSYQPNANYYGTDWAVVRLHDGQSTTSLRIDWEVTPVNDAPLSISVQTQPIPENSPHGAELGFVSIVDADRDASYRITSSDTRFSVSQGRIYLTSGGLDFETEPTLVIQLVAYDTSDASISIGTSATLSIADVNEPPTGIRLSSLSVPENSPSAVVGEIQVIDPDVHQDYEFSVSDLRFVVDGNVLRLAADARLNFEQEPKINISLTARDRSNPDFEVADDFILTVADRNDPPSGIRLSRLQVEALTDGGTVGEVSVEDEDGDEYQFSVSDGRFEVVDGILKLRPGIKLSGNTVGDLTLTVVATSHNGDQLSNAFPVQVVPPRSPWQNPSNPHDVNGDGMITPLDVLLLINQLNKDGAQPLPTSGNGGGNGEAPPVRPDVNGDGILTPLDALLIINELNRARGGEGEFDGDLNPPATFQQTVDSRENDEERRKRNNSEIDAELELLLDQISREQLGR